MNTCKHFCVLQCTTSIDVDVSAEEGGYLVRRSDVGDVPALHGKRCPIIRRLHLICYIVYIQFHPWRCQHVVYKVVLSKAPVSRQLFQLESNDLVVCVQHCVHVRVQSL